MLENKILQNLKSVRVRQHMLDDLQYTSDLYYEMDNHLTDILNDLSEITDYWQGYDNTNNPDNVNDLQYILQIENNLYTLTITPYWLKNYSTNGWYVPDINYIILTYLDNIDNKHLYIEYLDLEVYS